MSSSLCSCTSYNVGKAMQSERENSINPFDSNCDNKFWYLLTLFPLYTPNIYKITEINM